MRPFRTFREIEQPESPFIVRIKSGIDKGQAPQCMLRPADGGAWELVAVARIKEYLAERLPDIIIVS